MQQEVLLATRRAANRPVIVEEYDLGSIGMAGYDHCLFNKRLVDRLSEDLDKQDAWIRRVQAARLTAEASEPVRRRAAMTNLRAMLLWLGHGMRAEQLSEDDANVNNPPRAAE